MVFRDIDDFSTTLDSFYKLPNYTSNHRVRGGDKGCGVSAYIY